MTAIPPIKAAEWFIGQGFKVFPVWGIKAKGICRCPLAGDCTSPGKHPSVVNGFKNATDDIERVKTFLANPGTSNYGLVPPPDVISVDVDGDEGKRQWDALQHDHGPLPATLTTQTANGWHNFFKVDPEKQGKRLFGFVTRTHESGYTIGPGSIHHTGVAYGMLNGKLGIQPLPEAWIEEGFPRPRKPRSITVGGPPNPKMIEEGHRHDYLRDRARTLRGGGLEGEALFNAVWALNEQLASPKSRDEVERAIGDVETKFGADPVRMDIHTPEPVGPTLVPTDYERIVAGLTFASQATPSPYANEWLVEGLMRPKGIVVLAGPEGLGKSWVRAELAVRLATQEGSLFGVYPMKAKTAVLLLDEENGEDVEYEREEDILSALGLTRLALGGNYARMSFAMTDLESEDGRRDFETRIDAISAQVVIVDTGGVTVAEEHGPGFASAMRYVRGVSEKYRVVVLFVVHLVKPSHDMRDRAAAQREGRTLAEVMGHWGRHADSVWQLSDAGDGKLHFDVRKRWGESRAIITRADGLFKSVKVVTPTMVSQRRKNDVRILGALKWDGPGKAEAIADYLDKQSEGGLSVRTIYRRLVVLVDEGFVGQDVTTGVYTITTKGEDEVVAHARAGITLVLDGPGSTD